MWETCSGRGRRRATVQASRRSSPDFRSHAKARCAHVDNVHCCIFPPREQFNACKSARDPWRLAEDVT
eukprot:2200656-Pyramimonas_sp.AAC.1